MVGGLASSARPEQLHKISKRRVLLKNYARVATPPLTSKLISIEMRLQRKNIHNNQPNKTQEGKETWLQWGGGRCQQEGRW
jgi:hypothetical protein